jgi:alpha-L-rhamnosidase
VVPYEFWKYYGDDKYIRLLYPQMLRYFDFLDEHSECGLVTSDIKGVWCLGEWCTPPDQSNLPAPYVNTYFYIWAMQRTIEIAKAIGKEEDVPALEARIAPRKRMMELVYGNTFQRDSSYCGNVQGANAYALGIGLKADKTVEKLVNYYDRLGYYDTGIFSTELVTRKLFEVGAADVAFKLLTASEPWGFGKWAREGATTFREYWGTSRSHSHPMFGGVVACFFEYILGIRQESDSVGYDRIVISPVNIGKLGRASGHITTPHGRIAVAYEKKDGKTSYTVEIPAGVSARIALDGIEETTVGEGVYKYTV